MPDQTTCRWCGRCYERKVRLTQGSVTKAWHVHVWAQTPHRNRKPAEAGYLFLTHEAVETKESSKADTP